MKIVLFGATGKAGQVILKELVRRGHSVTAVARYPDKISRFNGMPTVGVSTAQDDLTDVAKTVAVIKSVDGGADAVVSAVGPPPENTDALIGATEVLMRAVAMSAAPQLVVVGGAASLFVAPGVTLRESGHLPEQWNAIADAHIKVLEKLKQSGIDWTYFSPAAFFEPGERTGVFRLGKDDLITDAAGNSKISFEDYAIALVDELERPKHRKARFTIGY